MAVDVVVASVVVVVDVVVVTAGAVVVGCTVVGGGLVVVVGVTDVVVVSAVVGGAVVVSANARGVSFGASDSETKITPAIKMMKPKNAKGIANSTFPIVDRFGFRMYCARSLVEAGGGGDEAIALIASVHDVPSQYRSALDCVESGYQPAGRFVIDAPPFPFRCTYFRRAQARA